MSKRSWTELVAYHEAGHAVIASRFGLLRKKGASIVPENRSSGRVHPRAGRDVDGDTSSGQAQAPRGEARHDLHGRIEAQRRYNPRTVRFRHFESDRDQAIDWLGTVCEFNSEQFAAYWKLLQIRTRDMVQGHWWRIEAVAATAAGQQDSHRRPDSRGHPRGDTAATRGSASPARSERSRMTPQEHKLVMAIFTVQHHLTPTLIDVLKSRDLLTDDDLEAFAAVNYELSMPESAEKIADAYRTLARKVGVPLQ